MNAVPFDNLTINKDIQMEILVVGMNNIGFEIVKNLILSNILNITIRDNTSITKEDIANMIYYGEKFINQNKTEIYNNLFYLINSNANIKINNDLLDEENIKKYNIIIFTNNDLNEIYYINDIARKYNIKIIVTEVRGIYGYIFTDYGDKYISTNKNGNIPKSGKIIKLYDNAIEIEYPCNLEINDKIYIKIDENHICRCKIIDINDNNTIFTIKNFDKVIKKNKIKLENSNLYFLECKEDIEYSSVNLLESQMDPKFNNNANEQKLLHWLTFSINKFNNKYKRNPTNSREDINKLQDYLKIIDKNLNYNNLNKLIENLNNTIYPIQGFYAGIICYEILKIINNIGIPINQWLYINFQNIYDDINNIKSNIVINNLDNFGIEFIKNAISENFNKLIINDKNKITFDDINGILFFDETNIGESKLKFAKKNIDKYLNKYNNNVNLTDNNLEILINENNIIKKKNSINIYFDLITCTFNLPELMNDNKESLELKDISIEECIRWSKSILKYYFNNIPNNFINYKYYANEITVEDYNFIKNNYSENPNNIITFAYNFWKNIFNLLDQKVDEDSLYYITIVANIWCQICYQPSVTMSLVANCIKKIENKKIDYKKYDINNKEIYQCDTNDIFDKDIVIFDMNNLDNLEIYFSFIKYSIKIKLKKYKIIIDDEFIKKIDIYNSSYIMSSIVASLATIVLNKNIKINLMTNTYSFF